MGLRITTWNVNGIRNPFGYQPWRDKRTFEGMFDILESDIICLQETKIQRKDLRDDMVLVPGFDCYWSLPKHKKGYSGVVIYTRNDKCAPIKAEEGITGILKPPNSTTSFRDMSEEEQIGGYPSMEQLSLSEIDPATLDSEGRCVILEFPAFVVIGTYCPAERDETRSSFRYGFLQMVDARIRNLVKMGKRVIWLGDMNISREEIDTAMAEEMMRRNDTDAVEWISSPARRLFNQMLVDGKVHGERDEGRETQIMWDICRGFHDGRKGMYTCWETKVNARPGNFGARIDYVVCSHGIKEWFCESNIQEGLMGSDHCPVYAVTKNYVDFEGKPTSILDLANPPGMFEDGIRKIPWSAKNLLPMSGKLIPEFDRRRSIRDMFTSKPALTTEASSIDHAKQDPSSKVQAPVMSLLPAPVLTPVAKANTSPNKVSHVSSQPGLSPPKQSNNKRPARSELATPAKRSKSSNNTNGTGKGQQSLKGFFKSKVAETENIVAPEDVKMTSANSSFTIPDSATETISPSPARSERSEWSFEEESANTAASRQSWGKLFAKPVAPKCDHDEPCKTMLTRKPGINCGRSFWMCNRPLGPSGKQEKGTQWRCNVFIWCSDWDTRGETG